MRLEGQTPHLGGPGLCSPSWLTAEESLLVQRFDPAGPLDTIGTPPPHTHTLPSCDSSTLDMTDKWQTKELSDAPLLTHLSCSSLAPGKEWVSLEDR